MGISITEIMYNPKSFSDYDFEWIEIFNESDESINLKNYRINDNIIDQELILKPNETLIVCRELYDDSEEKDSFEEVYGNGSGNWGDSEEENGKIVELSISLLNTSDSIKILNADNEQADEVEYSDSLGADGNDRSLEVYNSDIVESMNAYGTPGKKLFKATLFFSNENIEKDIKVSYNDNQDLFYELTSILSTVNLYHLENNKSYFLEIKSQGYQDYSNSFKVSGENVELSIKLSEKTKYRVSFVFKNELNQTLDNVDVFIENTEEEKVLSSGEKLSLYRGEYKLFINKKGYLGVYRNITVENDKSFIIRLPNISNLKINELDFDSDSTDIEWIELYNSADTKISLIDVVIQDKNMINKNEKLIFDKSIIIKDYIILTSDKKKFEQIFFSDSRIYEIKNLFSMNDSSETIKIMKDKKEIEKLQYNSGILNEKVTSLERINSKYECKEYNFYPSFGKTPLNENSVDNMINNQMEVIITEVYPFGKKEYIELYVKKTGNLRGILLNIFELTDLDNSYRIESSEIFNKGEVLVLKNKLSLNDYGDQIILNSVCDGYNYNDSFSYKKKYSNLNSEKEDFKNISNKNKIFIYEEKDKTKSFNYNYNLNKWIYTNTTKGYIGKNIESEKDILHISKKIPQTGNLMLEYSFTSKKEIVLKIYDTGGMRRKMQKFYLEGSGEKKITFNSPKGRFLYLVKIREGEKSNIKRGSFIVY